MAAQKKKLCIADGDINESLPPKKKVCFEPPVLSPMVWPMSSYERAKSGFYYLQNLDDEIFCRIFDYIPVHQRKNLEYVSKRFQNSVFRTYRSVKSLNLDNFAYESRQNFSQRINSDRCLSIFLLKICRYFPNLETISGFRSFVNIPSPRSLDFLSDLPKLKSVSFKHCYLKESDLNNFLLKCPNLIDLDLSFAFILPDGKIMWRANNGTVQDDAMIPLYPGFKNLTKLESFNAQGLNVKSDCWAFLDAINSPALKNVDFMNCQFETNNAVRFFKRLPSIQCLNLSACVQMDSSENYFYRKEIFQVLKKSASKFESLIIGGYSRSETPETAPFLDIAAGHMIDLLTSPVCSQLKELDLRFSYVPTDKVINGIIGNLPNLEILRLAIEAASNECLEKLKYLQNLKDLRLEGFNSYGRLENIVSSWSNLKRLEKLTLVMVKMSKVDLGFLVQFRNFYDFYISRVKISDRYVRILCEKFGPQLQNLLLFPMKPLSNFAVEEIAKKCRNLVSLSIQAEIESTTLRLIGEMCEKLEKLKITSSLIINNTSKNKFENEDLLFLMENCKHLKNLSLDRNFLESLWKEKEFHLKYKHRVRLVATF